jgi:hypothetical protein
LHTPDGIAWYVQRNIEPAFFTPKEVQDEIDRLSTKFGEHPREFRMPQREESANGLIAIWGKVQLEALSPSDVSRVASGGSPKGPLVFLEIYSDPQNPASLFTKSRAVLDSYGRPRLTKLAGEFSDFWP